MPPNDPPTTNHEEDPLGAQSLLERVEELEADNEMLRT